MRPSAIFLAVLLSSGPAAAQEAHRQLGPHQHGHGELNIAIEGKRVSMELHAPGADIVGFEHAPGTDAERATLDGAHKKLKDALALFKMPAAADCRVQTAAIEVEQDEHEHEEHAGEGHKADAAGKPEEHEHGHQHSDFRVIYALDCTAPDRITSIEFGYFAAFAGAQELEVSIVSDKGQTQHEVTRDKPVLSLSGLI